MMVSRSRECACLSWSLDSLTVKKGWLCVCAFRTRLSENACWLLFRFVVDSYVPAECHYMTTTNSLDASSAWAWVYFLTLLFFFSYQTCVIQNKCSACATHFLVIAWQGVRSMCMCGREVETFNIISILRSIFLFEKKSRVVWNVAWVLCG